MDMTKVLSSGVSIQIGKLGNNTILGSLQRHHHANFTLRRKYAIRFFGVTISLPTNTNQTLFQNYTNMWEQTRNADTILRTNKTEAYVMRDFFRNTGAIESDKYDSEYEVGLLWMDG
jgi:hypothetical protein